MEWMVQLIGDSSDLSALAESLNAADVNISHDGQSYIMMSAAFSSDLSADGVRKKAQDIVDVLNGAIRLVLDSTEAIRLGAVYRIRDDGSREISVFPEPNVIHLRAVAGTVQITHVDGTVQVFHPAAPVKEWLAIAAQSKAVAKVLRLVAGGPFDWVNLYKAFEIVEADVGGVDAVASAGWATKSSIRLFKHTANSPGAIGLESRHGKEANDPPPRPMTISEARSLVTSLIHAWLRSKPLPLVP